MLSSTTMPIATMMASREMMLNVKPISEYSSGAALTEMGMASTTANTVFRRPRNSSTTRPTAAIPMKNSL